MTSSSFIGIIILVLIVGKTNLYFQFKKEVKQLFSQSKIVSDKRFSYVQLPDLPEPVQRYFKHVLKEGEPYISYVRLKYSGTFKTGENKKWVNIKGEQYYTTDKPGFIWKGETSMFTARDMFINDKGKLVVSLFSVFRVVNGKGQKYNQGELLRWLGESVWFPTNLLPSENLQWTPINNESARLVFTHQDLSLFYIVKFNKADEIEEIETKRYMGEKDLETWLGRLSEYKNINGISIPTTIEAIYKLDNRDYSYAKFHIKEIEYNTAEIF